jgi:acetylornithine deacetylase/succinyl-diaminopimelate desuccinylase-like protein
MWGRGVVDDKGQVWIHVKAIEAFLATVQKLPINLKLIVEGEEEIGSNNLDALMREHSKELEADFVCVSDTAMFGRGIPSLCVGLRGLAILEVNVEGPKQDLHSGSFGGGVANPVNVLAKMIAALHDDTGRVTVPGFYDRVRDLTDDERAAYAAQPFDPEIERDRLGVPAWSDGERGWTLLERMSGRPTFDINGLWGGYSGEGAKTIIPAWAAAKFSTRLVPDQDYREIERLITRHVESLAPSTVKVEIKVIHGGAPAITPLDHPGVRLGADALEAAFGKAPLYHRTGGSVPVVAALDTTLGLKSVLIGFASPNGNFHSPNEWMPLWNVRGGMNAIVRLWERFGSVTPEELSG